MLRFLCDPAKAVLDAMVARGESFTMPTVEFDEPIYGTLGAPGDQRLVQFVVQGAILDFGGVQHPALVFTGRTPAGPLPNWVYAASDDQLRGMAQVVHDMAELAIRTADAHNGVPRG